MADDFTRRRLLSGVGAASLAAVAAACTGTADTAARPTTMVPGTLDLPVSESTLGDGSFSLFGQDDLNFQTLLALGGADLNATVGEVITVVDQANAAAGGASYQTLYDAMVAMGNQLDEQATDAANRGHRVTASARFLRAAQYYNQALYWVLGTDTPGAEAEVYRVMDDAFTKGVERMDPPGERISIPYESTSMPAWFFRPDDTDARRPTLILNNGSDGQLVDMIAQGGRQALDRGYNLLIFEGPGQGSLLFEQNIVFRPDWEAVIAPIIDELVTRDDVDASKIVLRGISFGGLLCPRAAAFEKRLAAVVCDPGDVDAFASYPQSLQEVANDGDQDNVNKVWTEVIIPGATAEQTFALKKRLEIYTQEAHTQAAAGQVPTDWYTISRTIQTFDISDVAGQISCPTFVAQYAGDDLFFTGGQDLYDKLGSQPKTLVELTATNGSQYHCGPMNPQYVSEVVYDWLDETLDIG